MSSASASSSVTFPLLYGEASTGKVKQWSISVVEEDGCGVITVEHGYLGGKLQQNRKVIREGKNLGKRNATTAMEQAIAEARAQWVKKKESGYAPKGVEEEKGEAVGAVGAVEEKGRGKGQNETAPTVMLAHDYHKRGKDIIYPCFVQPKLDGTRCVAVPGKGLFSRNKKAYPHLEHIRRVVDRLPATMVLDGELYSDELSFQEIVGLVKSETVTEEEEKKAKKIRLHVYDLVCDLPYHQRWMNLQMLFRRLGAGRETALVLVETEHCENEEEMKAKHAEYMERGYEGVMLRNREGMYRGVRSTALQKYKEFLDDEYPVVGFQEGQGLEEGCVIWMCQTPEGALFSCRPRGSREDRQRLFQEGEQYVGKMLTVRYQEKTDAGLPRFPVGITFRDYE
jgi:ATP-dependent DNA ligase